MRKQENDDCGPKPLCYVCVQLKILGEEKAYRAFAAIAREKAKNFNCAKAKIEIEDLMQEVLKRIAMNPEQFGENEDQFRGRVYQCIFQRYLNFCKKKGIANELQIWDAPDYQENLESPISPTVSNDKNRVRDDADVTYMNTNTSRFFSRDTFGEGHNPDWPDELLLESFALVIGVIPDLIFKNNCKVFEKLHESAYKFLILCLRFFEDYQIMAEFNYDTNQDIAWENYIKQRGKWKKRIRNFFGI